MPPSTLGPWARKWGLYTSGGATSQEFGSAVYWIRTDGGSGNAYAFAPPNSVYGSTCTVLTVDGGASDGGDPFNVVDGGGWVLASTANQESAPPLGITTTTPNTAAFAFGAYGWLDSSGNDEYTCCCDDGEGGCSGYNCACGIDYCNHTLGAAVPDAGWDGGGTFLVGSAGSYLGSGNTVVAGVAVDSHRAIDAGLVGPFTFAVKYNNRAHYASDPNSPFPQPFCQGNVGPPAAHVHVYVGAIK
jgi:hypothetical protein